MEKKIILKIIMEQSTKYGILKFEVQDVPSLVLVYIKKKNPVSSQSICELIHMS